MNPVIFLWAHPRSMSTATERVMRERNDLHCLHEPFLHYYYLQKRGKRLNEFEAIAGYPTTYQGTRDMILDLAQHSTVFAKDMSYYVMPELFDDVEFCRQVQHAFLIRNPLKSILSYYRLDPQLSLEEVGLQAQWQHFQGLLQLDLNPVVLEAEAIQADTRRIMRAFWDSVGLPFCEHAFDWSDESTPQDWQYVKGWHQQASGSGGIKPVNTGDDEKAREAFERAAETAPFLHDYLELHNESYEELRRYSLTV